MTFGGNNFFNDFREIVPTGEVTTETEKTSRVLAGGCVGTIS